MSPEMRQIAAPNSQIDDPSDDEHEREIYKGWMNRFCVEPRNDACTCCLGCFCPCMLFGQIDNRLLRIEAGQDPRDLGNSCNGCNSSCAIYTATCRGLWGAMTATRRIRIRGIYGIDGKFENDFVASMFCDNCVLMQADREIRARAGQTNLRNSHKYRKTVLINSQPGAAPQMRYASPRETSSSNQEIGPNTSQSKTLQSAPKKLQRPYQPVQSNTPSDLTREAANSLSQGNDNQNVIRPPRNMPQLLYQQKPMKLRDVNDIEGSQLKSKHPRSNRQENKPSKVKAKAYLLSSEKENAGSGTSAKAGLTKHIPTEERGFRSFLNTSVHDLADCLKHDTMEKEATKTEAEPATPQQTLIDCSQIEVDARFNGPPETHVLAECAKVETVTVISRKSGTSDRSLTDYEAIVIAEESNSTHSPQELSYVHDFTDCPVDKGTLEYYEKEEERAQAHGLEDCTRSSSKSGILLKETRQHRLSNCARESPTAQDVSRARGVQQHELDECHQVGSATAIIPEESLQYGLPDCCHTSFSSPKGVQQHRLTNCKRPSSTMADLMKEIEEHGLVDCTRVSSISTLRGETKQQEVPDCCQEESKSSYARAIQPHKLSDCMRASSISAALLKQPQQHGPDDCTRSSSLGVLTTRSIKQHDLSGCTRFSSTSGSQSNDPYSSYAHDIYECLEDQGSTDSGNSGSTIKVHQKKFDKGKQHAEDQCICQPCPHVTFKHVENQRSKRLDITTVEGRVESGKGKGKTYIPDTDGDESARQSRSREHSAEHALAQVRCSG